MSETAPDLTALIGSRICHDLISPLGAIGNGVELLGMSLPPSPELALITESVTHAMARIRMFRLSFGTVRDEQRISGREVASILEGLGQGGRVRFDWSLPADLPRREAKLLMLLVQCCESALAWGGTVTVAHDGTRWTVTARGGRLRLEPSLWEPLGQGRSPDETTPAEVHFAVAARMLAAEAIALTLDTGDEEIVFSF